MHAGLGLLVAVAGWITVYTTAPASAQGAIERVSIGPNGAEADGSSFNPVISADGRFVAFYTDPAIF